MQRQRLFHIIDLHWNQPLYFIKHEYSKMGIAKKIIKDKREMLTNIEKDLVVKNVRVTYSLKHYEAMVSYFDSKEHLKLLKNDIPQHFWLRKYKFPNCMYTVDKNVAYKLFEALYPHLKTDKGHILEFNAGLGLLTELLMDARLPRLRIYESDTGLYKKLCKLVGKKNSDAKIFKTNMLMLWRMTWLDREDGQNRVRDAFDGLPSLSWEDEPVMKIIGAISSESFIFHVMYSIIFLSGMCTFGRPELFLIMRPITFSKLTARPGNTPNQYRSKAVLFHIFFEHAILSTVEEKAFVPWMSKPKRKMKKESNDDDVMYLVKVTARQDLFQKVPPHLIKALWFFVRQMMRKSTSSVIVKFEEWVPGCGPRLIAQGYTVYSECGKVLPEEFLRLFLEFSSWPEFQSSSFLSSVETLIMKMADPGMCEEIMADNLAQEKSDMTPNTGNVEQTDSEQSDDETADGEEKIDSR